MQTDVLLEGVLFYTATPQKKKRLCQLLGCEDAALQEAVASLQARLTGTALRILETDQDLQLVTAPELSDFIASLRQNELSEDIGKAGAETLAIILYREPITRGEIDRIRGVNSSAILRKLMTRGLIERRPTKNTYEFRIAPALLQQLGTTHKHELPQFGEFMTKIDEFVTVQ